MYKLFTIFSTSSLLQGHEANQSILAFMKGLPRLIRVVNRRAFSTIGTTLMLSALLSACGGSTSTTSSTSPTTTAPTTAATTSSTTSTTSSTSSTSILTTPTFSISSSSISIDENFATPQLVATVTDATAITVSQSNTGVVTVTTSNAQVNVLSIPNATGRTTLTITATNGTLSATTQVTVTVNPVNNTPTPTFTVLSSNLSFDVDFTGPRTVASVSNATSITVSQSNPGVVTVTNSNTQVNVSSIANAFGRTILTITATNGSLVATTQVTVIVNAANNTPTPTFTVSSSNFSIDEDFMGSRTVASVTNATAITVSQSNTGVVTVTNSNTQVNVLSIRHATGRTTLTITATNGRLFVTTQVTVTVNSVNDPPTISVTSNGITVGSTPVVLTVTAFDVEDSTLSFSVSTGQGVFNTAITATSLTITRLDFSVNAPQILLTLRTTDTDNASTFTIVTVLPEPMFTLTTGIKTLDFAWSAISSATHYQLQSNPDGGSGFTDLSTAGIVVSPNSTNIRQTTAQVLVALHRYIPNVTNPQYSANTCYATPCGISLRHNTVSLTNAQLNSMIGRLQASNAEGGDQFGGSVSLSGDGNTLAVGAFLEDSSLTGVNVAQNDNSANNSGAVYVFRRIGGAWVQQAYIKASNTGLSDFFGTRVSLNGDGNTLVVGARSEDSSSNGINGAQNDNSTDTGAVYLFRFNTTSGAWAQQAYIKASNAGQGDEFGFSVSLSDNGNTLAVAAYKERSSSTGVNGAQNDNTASDSGAVYVFRFNTASNTWFQQEYIKASNAGQLDQFGESLSLSADGNTLAVGANGEASSSTGVNGAQDDNTALGSGAVYLFRFNTTSNSWAQQAYIKASNTEGGDEFGRSVSLSADGNALAVGAVYEDSSITGVNGAQDDNAAIRSGAAYVFRFSTTSSTWSQQAYIKASNTGAGDFFGRSVSLSADGNILAVGAFLEAGSATGVGGVDDSDTDAGATYVFEFANGAWAQQAYIRATGTAAGAQFGFSVSLSSSGNSLAVGAIAENSLAGAVYLY